MAGAQVFQPTTSYFLIRSHIDTNQWSQVPCALCPVHQLVTMMSNSCPINHACVLQLYLDTCANSTKSNKFTVAHFHN